MSGSDTICISLLRMANHFFIQDGDHPWHDPSNFRLLLGNFFVMRRRDAQTRYADDDNFVITNSLLNSVHKLKLMSLRDVLYTSH